MRSIFFILPVTLAAACGLPSQTNTELQSEEAGIAPEFEYGYINNGESLIGVTYKREGESARVGDDMLVPMSMILSSSDTSNGLNLASSVRTVKWPGGRVPYVLPKNFDYNAEFKANIDTWAQSGITWVPKTASDKFFINVVQEDRFKSYCGASYLGMVADKLSASQNLGVPNSQPFFLPKRSAIPSGACKSMTRTAIHEGGHALGFYHEQARSDRDSFIKIDPSIATSSQYAKIDGMIPLSPYDLLSIMHYSTQQSGGKMTKLNGEAIPLNTVASAQDISGARAFYASAMNPQTQAIPTPVTPGTPGSTSVATPMPPSAPTPSTPPVQATALPTAIKQTCRVVSVRLENLYRGQETNSDCQAKCNSVGGENRACYWGNTVLREHPKKQCVIKRSSGNNAATLFSGSQNIRECEVRCAGFNAIAQRTCTWGGQNVK